MIKPLVYIASPYTKGDVGINVRFQMRIWQQLMYHGSITPYAPLWSHFQHIHDPQPYEFWLGYCLDIVPRCDAVLRLTATDYVLGYRHEESEGADREVALAQTLGIPVFYTVDDLCTWVENVYYAS